MKLRRANSTDAVDIWNWRNDPLTRAMSRASGIVSWESHCEWFARALEDKSAILYIVMEKEPRIKLGVVRFDIKSAKCIAEVSINLNPEMRGQGLGKLMLNLAIEEFFKYFSLNLVAEVKPKNAASIKLFTALGFREIGMENEMQRFSKPFG